MIRKIKKKISQNPKQQRSKQTISSYYLYRSVGEPVRGQTSHLFWYKTNPNLFDETFWWEKAAVKDFSIGTWSKRSSCLGKGWHNDNTLLALPPNSSVQLWPPVPSPGRVNSSCREELGVDQSSGQSVFSPVDWKNLACLVELKNEAGEGICFPAYKYILENKCERRERRWDTEGQRWKSKWVGTGHEYF